MASAGPSLTLADAIGHCPVCTVHTFVLCGECSLQVRVTTGIKNGVPGRTRIRAGTLSDKVPRTLGSAVVVLSASRADSRSHYPAP